MNAQQQFNIPPQSARTRRVSRRQLRLVRARWWFEQMRRAVEQADEPGHTSLAAVEQHALPLDRVA